LSHRPASLKKSHEEEDRQGELQCAFIHRFLRFLTVTIAIAGTSTGTAGAAITVAGYSIADTNASFHLELGWIVYILQDSAYVFWFDGGYHNRVDLKFMASIATRPSGVCQAPNPIQGISTPLFVLKVSISDFMLLIFRFANVLKINRRTFKVAGRLKSRFSRLVSFFRLGNWHLEKPPTPLGECVKSAGQRHCKGEARSNPLP
jgi:hypothetical protein